MYGFRHHVAGEEGLAGTPEHLNSVRYTGRVLLAAALLAGCVGLSGVTHSGSGVFEVLCVLLLVGGGATLIYESPIQDRISRWRG